MGDLFISVFIRRGTSRWQIGGVWSGIANIAAVRIRISANQNCPLFMVRRSVSVAPNLFGATVLRGCMAAEIDLNAAFHIFFTTDSQLNDLI
jgi:hypothetical protein